MRPTRPLLALFLLVLLTFGCARHKKGKNATATAEPVRTEAAAPAVAPTAARDLTDVMTDELQLRPDQQVKVRAILSSTVTQVNDAQKQFAGNRTGLMTELKRINASSEGQLRQVLTPTQYKNYQVKKRAMQAEMQARKSNQ
ncbi:hypothetical protein [Hymenobacter sp. BT491]|uniref:hypothetical protein n=1 Tax=Hymenobacter sp. BT491 TaxID=2766779 RepID=UPI0016535C8F|nr:hypothetical protein [Hymenobacter sp. BT491]MBC6991129.1 hypothetical protein [Hymenobacter sp. BT491]